MGWTLPSFAPLLFVSVVLGCGGSVNESSLPGDGHMIRCEKGMLDCVRRAQMLCKERGYTVVAGKEMSRVLGGSTSAYRRSVNEGELQIYCGDSAPPSCQPEQQSEDAVYQLSVAPEGTPSPTNAVTPEAAQASAGAAVSPGASVPPAAPVQPTRLCVPGGTQRCVGPGACDGGQVCSPDGLSFGPCDCGTTSATPRP